MFMLTIVNIPKNAHILKLFTSLESTSLTWTRMPCFTDLAG